MIPFVSDRVAYWIYFVIQLALVLLLFRYLQGLTTKQCICSQTITIQGFHMGSILVAEKILWSFGVSHQLEFLEPPAFLRGSEDC